MTDIRIHRTIAREVIEESGMLELHQIWEDVRDGSVHSIIKMKNPMGVSKTYTEELRSTMDAPWVSSWLCRGLRQVGNRWFPRWFPFPARFTQVSSHYPGWLRYLIGAKMEVVEHEHKKFPDSVYEQIVIQCALLSAKGIEPKRLMIGKKANFALYSDKEYPAYVEYQRQDQIRVYVSSGFYMTLLYEINEFLAENAVLVIGDPA